MRTKIRWQEIEMRPSEVKMADFVWTNAPVMPTVISETTDDPLRRVMSILSAFTVASQKEKPFGLASVVRHGTPFFRRQDFHFQR